VNKMSDMDNKTNKEVIEMWEDRLDDVVEQDRSGKTLPKWDEISNEEILEAILDLMHMIVKSE
jgi:hypothetical protein